MNRKSYFSQGNLLLCWNWSVTFRTALNFLKYVVGSLHEFFFFNILRKLLCDQILPLRNFTAWTFASHKFVNEMLLVRCVNRPMAHLNATSHLHFILQLLAASLFIETAAVHLALAVKFGILDYFDQVWMSRAGHRARFLFRNRFVNHRGPHCRLDTGVQMLCVLYRGTHFHPEFGLRPSLIFNVATLGCYPLCSQLAQVVRQVAVHFF